MSIVIHQASHPCLFHSQARPLILTRSGADTQTKALVHRHNAPLTQATRSSIQDLHDTQSNAGGIFYQLPNHHSSCFKPHTFSR